MPSPSTDGVQWGLIRNQGCGPTLPDSLSTMPLSFEKKSEDGGGQKEGADSYVYADMYFKASISPTLRRFVMGRVYIALLSIHNGFSTTPDHIRGRGSNESPKHCMESITTPTLSSIRDRLHSGPWLEYYN